MAEVPFGWTGWAQPLDSPGSLLVRATPPVGVAQGLPEPADLCPGRAPVMLMTEGEASPWSISVLGAGPGTP